MEGVMKLIKAFIPMIIFISLFFANDLFAQRGYWGRGRGCRGLRMGYGRMVYSQGVDTINAANYWGPGFGRGYGRGGGGWGMRNGRWNNFRNVNPVYRNRSAVQPGAWGIGRGYYSQGAYGRIYNPQTEETIRGTIVGIENYTSYRRGYYGIHLMVETNEETIPVHLGPAWFIENQNMIFSVDDKIEIVGSRIIFETQPAIVAAEVKKGDTVLTLRDEIGIPIWSGRGWRNW
jgi:hypothetical protein